MLKTNPSDSRNPIFDLLKIILTVLVVNIHIRIIIHKVQPNFLEAYVWYVVPLFITLSFFLTSRIYICERPSLTSLFRRLKRLTLPFIFWSAMGFLIRPELVSAKNLIIQCFTGQVVNLPLYYLVLLIWYTTISWFIAYLPKRLKQSVYFGIIIIAFIVEYKQISYLFFNPMDEAVKKSYGRFVELIKYASSGILFGYLITKIKDKINYLLIVSVTFFIIYIISLIFKPPPGFHYAGVSLLTSVVSVFSFILWLSLQKLSHFNNRVIVVLGKYSFGVYLFHFPLLEYLLKIVPQIKYFIDSFSIIFLILYVVGCYLFCFLVDNITCKKFSYLIE